MNEQMEIMQAMMDDEFHQILENDEVLAKLEQEKFSQKDEYFELMMSLSKTFMIDGLVISCITPAVWAYLYAIGSPYATDGEIHEIDTDIILYVLHHGIEKIDANLVDNASGFCGKHGLDVQTAENDLKTLIYLSFRPLEMLDGDGGRGEKPRFNLDWLTHLVSVVSPMTGKTSGEVIYDTSLTECFYYCIQKARMFDDKGQIRRRNSGEINEAVYMRTMELGRKYWEEHYGC